MRQMLGWLGVLALLGVWGCNGDGAQASFRDPDAFVSADSVQILDDLRILSHDSLEGRRTGTRGGALAREYIQGGFQTAGLHAPPGGVLQAFEFSGRQDSTQVIRGANVVGFVEGTEPELGAIVLTAHFDHLGLRAPRAGGGGSREVDSIYNGADDNASGTASVMAMARFFARRPPRHTMVFAALDAEEMGLRGARAFVDAGWPEQIVLNVNLDMVARSDSLLFVAGTHHYPHLRPILESVQGREPVVLRFGHDRPDVEGVQDWTGLSDHRAFHARGIPFLYFGVEDHPDYHRPSDEFDRIEPVFFLNAIRTILSAVLTLDEALPGEA
ncbi:MAG: M28 family peptidase [Gemmatimonadota bacterium]